MTSKTPTLKIYAASQPEYLPLPAAQFEDGTVMTEWVLTAEELSALINGGHLRLWLWTFNRPMQPVMFQVVNSEGVPLDPPYTGGERRAVLERRRVYLSWSGERRVANRRRS